MSATPEWIPVFTRVLKDDEILKETYVFSTFRDSSVHCKLCDARVEGETTEQHLRRHRRELREYRKRREVESDRNRRAALEVRRREKDLEREVLGDERPSSLPEEKRLKNRVTSIRYKVNHPEKHGRDAWKPDELKRLQAQLDEAQAAVDAYKAKEAA